jgi:hypothetical protein
LADVTTSVESTIKFPYKRSLGPVIGAFMTALADQRIIGIRSGDRVLCPPLEWDPDTAAELAHDFVDVGGGHGRVMGWVSCRPCSTRSTTVRLRPDPARRRRHALVHVVDPGRSTPWPPACG